MGASSSNAATTSGPAHHVALGGLTGITHGTTRHVTWTLYHEVTGYHAVHLVHDGMTGARSLSIDDCNLVKSSYHLNVLDSSSQHFINLRTRTLLSSEEQKIFTSFYHRNDSNRTPRRSSTIHFPDPVAAIRIDEEYVRFLYTLQINCQSYRSYQTQFWSRAIMWTWPMVQVKRKKRGTEEGVPDHHHALICVHSPTVTFILNGAIIQSDCSFSENDDEGTVQSFEVEPGVVATMTTSLNAGATPLSRRPSITAKPANVRARFTYALRINHELIAPLPPPLMPIQWIPKPDEMNNPANAVPESKPLVEESKEEAPKSAAKEDTPESVTIEPCGDGLSSERVSGDAVCKNPPPVQQAKD